MTLLSLRSNRIFDYRLYFVLSVSVDTDRSKKHGQTCRAVVGAEILTSCNFKASLFDHLVAPFGLLPPPFWQSASFGLRP